MTSSPLILVPGYWLGAWAWDDVAADLRATGHQVTAVTRPGLHPDDDRARVRWSDQVDALEAAVRDAGPDVVVVAHSGAGAFLSGLLDRAPESVARAVYVDSGPVVDGYAHEPAPDAEAVDFPLPSWAELEGGGASLEGLSEERLAEFRARAVPEAAAVVREVVRLHDVRRCAVPTTYVNCSLTTAMVREFAEAGYPAFTPLLELSDVTSVELPTGHWPMLSRPHDLAVVLGAIADAEGVDQAG